jgi:ABC-2 type transport system permease protein
VAAHTLWFAPLYAWLLLVSGWARRVVLLWAIAPLLLTCIAMRVAFGTSEVPAFVTYRFDGAMREAFAADPTRNGLVGLSQLDPVGFLLAPGLWLGLVAAAVFLALAVRLRRRREPM